MKITHADLNEIYRHVQEIRKEKQSIPWTADLESTSSQQSPRNSQRTTMIIPTGEVSQELWDDLSRSTCDLCHQEIILGKNLSGLVIGNRYFACESCCQHKPRQDIVEWTRSRMSTGHILRPIGLWLTEEKNK